MSLPPDDRAILRIDLAALLANHHRLRQAAPGAKIAPVVKADSYGLGAAPIAKALLTDGARDFFVATLDEGIALRKTLGVGPTIYVLHGAREDQIPAFVRHALSPILNSLSQLTIWTEARREGASAAGLHIDTGMSRLGLPAADVTAATALAKAAGVELVMSHLACASDPAHPQNARQLARFRAAAAEFPGAKRSLANSAGIFLGPDYHFDLVRPGLALYGGQPMDQDGPDLDVVAVLSAPILQLRDLQPGDTVGYGADFTAQKPTRAATLSIGYADGFLRASGPQGYGVLAGARCPILGRVSMDLIVIDATPAGAAAVPGARVELMGPAVTLGDIARAANTIPYEVLARLGPRIERRYDQA
jgi:alanine racemase